MNMKMVAYFVSTSATVLHIPRSMMPARSIQRNCMSIYISNTPAPNGPTIYANGRDMRKMLKILVSSPLICLKKYVSDMLSIRAAPMRVIKRTLPHTMRLAEPKKKSVTVDALVMAKPANNNSFSPSHLSAIIPAGYSISMYGIIMMKSMIPISGHENPMCL